MSQAEQISVGFDPVRVCEAIARIGYEPHSAIMDLIDNSVTAGASSVNISLYLRPGKSLRTRNSVAKYEIVDNGSGMDQAEITNAFKLGSIKNYGARSLSKYGMGLKSAGLSLGSRISVVSRKNGVLSDRYTFDIEAIEQADDLVIIRQPLTELEIARINQLFSKESGTIVEVDGCENVNQSSPNNTITKLKERLGVVYYSFLKADEDPLQIGIRVCTNDSDEPYISILPRDLLFAEEAKENTSWLPETYDFVSPYLVLDEQWDSLIDKKGDVLPPIIIQAVAFPQASMGSEKSSLSPENKAIVKSYDISKENSGFFIYRNGRLIRWGDNLDGANGSKLIGKDDINIRIRFEITDAHDDVLHVDVSKQRLDVDDENLADLEKITAKALRTAKDIRNACRGALKTSDEEGKNFNRSVREVNEDDPQEADAGEPSPATLQRKEERNKEAQEVIIKLDEEDGVEDVSALTLDEFRKVRYSEKIPHGQAWKAYYDSKNGVFVCISKLHPFYEEFVSLFKEGSDERLAIEALIFSVGLAESNIFDNETQVGVPVLEKIFRRFHQNIDRFLSNWTYENLKRDD